MSSQHQFKKRSRFLWPKHLLSRRLLRHARLRNPQFRKCLPQRKLRQKQHRKPIVRPNPNRDLPAEPIALHAPIIHGALIVRRVTGPLAIHNKPVVPGPKAQQHQIAKAIARCATLVLPARAARVRNVARGIVHNMARIAVVIVVLIEVATVAALVIAVPILTPILKSKS